MLEAIIVHVGSGVAKAHYVTFVWVGVKHARHGQCGGWEVCDDSTVRIARETEVKEAQSTGYIFVYKRGLLKA